MSYKIKSKKKPKYAYVLKVGKDKFTFKSKKEMKERLENGIILWHYQMPKNMI
jgi:hypothetical protein